MLRCAQRDSTVTHTDAWINVFISMITHTADFAVSRNNPANRRCRFIVHTADLSAFAGFPII
jgi:hypothetical protein